MKPQLAFLPQSKGWRTNQEDAHIALSNLPEGNSSGVNLALFGVFDGHGGKDVSLFTEEVFVREFQASEQFKRGNYQEALRETFHAIDVLLEDPVSE